MFLRAVTYKMKVPVEPDLFNKLNQISDFDESLIIFDEDILDIYTVADHTDADEEKCIKMMELDTPFTPITSYLKQHMFILLSCQYFGSFKLFKRIFVFIIQFVALSF